MPFTPTHIIAILPIFYIFQRLPLSALAVGAIIPDFPMFFPISSYKFSHSIGGIFFYCIPMGMIVYFLFERIGKQFIIDISPLWMKSRLASYREEKLSLNANTFIMLLFALVIGSATHVIWDAFTHQGGWGVKLYPGLEQNIHLISFSIPLYKTIQYGSTLIGLPILLVFSVFYLTHFEPRTPIGSCYISKVKRCTIAFSFISIPMMIGSYHLLYGASANEVLGYTIKESIGGGILLFFLYASLHHWHRQSQLYPGEYPYKFESLKPDFLQRWLVVQVAVDYFLRSQPSL